MEFINLKIPSPIREVSYKRMQEIEEELKNQDPPKQIMITVSTEPPKGAAPRMTDENIEKEKAKSVDGGGEKKESNQEKQDAK